MSTPTSPIIVHHLNNSRSQRILWLLEELQLPYEVKRYERGSDMRAPKELMQIHPLGKSPVVTDGENTVAESGAIIEFLVDKYGNGRLKPAAGTPQALQYTYWMHFAEGTLMLPLVQSLVFSQIPKQSPFLIRPIANAISSAVQSKVITPDLTRIFTYIESHLQSNEWFAGSEMTAADVQMSFPLEAAMGRAENLMGEKTKAFVERVQSREAYKKALQKGGEYAYASKTSLL